MTFERYNGIILTVKTLISVTERVVDVSSIISAQKQDKKSKISKSTTDYIQQRKISTETYNTLKWIAMITMTFHHLAYVLLNASVISASDYIACNIIGRVAFPLYCFLLVECYYHTQNKTRHLLRLLVIAIISEVPWDYVSSGKIVNWRSQSVCVTLFLGFFMLKAMDIPVGKIAKTIRPQINENSKAICAFQKIISFDMCGIFALAAYLINGDYSWYGMLFIAVLRLAHNRKHRILWTVIGFTIFSVAQVNYDIIYLCGFIALPIIIIALKEDKLQNCKCCIGLHFLQKKPFELIARYYYPAHLVLLGLCKYILSVR